MSTLYGTEGEGGALAHDRCREHLRSRLRVRALPREPAARPRTLCARTTSKRRGINLHVTPPPPPLVLSGHAASLTPY